MDTESLGSASGYFKFTSTAPVSDDTELVFHSLLPVSPPHLSPLLNCSK